MSESSSPFKMLMSPSTFDARSFTTSCWCRNATKCIDCARLVFTGEAVRWKFNLNTGMQWRMRRGEAAVWGRRATGRSLELTGYIFQKIEYCNLQAVKWPITCLSALFDAANCLSEYWAIMSDSCALVDVDVDVVDLRAQADASKPASNNNVNYTIYSNF